jgi:hypothetical protein
MIEGGYITPMCRHGFTVLRVQVQSPGSGTLLDDLAVRVTGEKRVKKVAEPSHVFGD